MIKLIIEDDEGKTTIVPLIRDEITIGRKEGNTIRLTERNVSRRHAKLLKQNGQVFVEDLDSYNGIKVNKEKIEGRVPVKEGDKIVIGDYILALKYDSPAAASKPDPFEEMKTIPLERAPVPEPTTPAGGTVAPAPPAAPAPPKQAGGPGPQPATAPSPAAAETVQPPAQQEKAAQSAPSPQAQPAAGPAAKLVVISEEFFGREISLDLPTMVLGRMPENEIVLDHGSISRHHAKIVKDGSHYTIFDLGSQNGVLVNGEKYDRIELRKGDILDLGHVRFRFVAPGEHFVPSRTAAGLSSVKGSKTGLYVGLAILGLALVAVAYFVFRPSKTKKGSDETSQTSGAVATQTDNGQQPRPVTLDYSKIENALAAQDWDKAITEAKAFLQAHPDDQNAKKKLEKARAEAKNETRYKKFIAAWRAGKVKRAVNLGHEFPRDSTYYKDFKDTWPQVVDAYTNQLLKKAKALASKKKCADVRILARQAIALKPDEPRFQPIIDRCIKGTQVADRSSLGTRPTRAHTRPRNRASSSQNSGTGDKKEQAKALLKEARTAWGGGNCGKAIRLAKKSYRLSPSRLAAVIAGSCGCSTHRKSVAAWAYRRVSSAQKNLLIKSCKARGITLP